MTSLKEQWQAQRQQRQAEVAQRQQQVQNLLAELSTARQIQAAQLQDDLSLFVLELQHNTQLLLYQIAQERHVQHSEFLRSLRQQTSEFLTLTAIERMLMAEQLVQQLKHFRMNLMNMASAMRSHIRAQLEVIQEYVQELRTVYQQEHMAMSTQLRRELATFVDTLQSEVEVYLSELALMRQDRAQQLQQFLQQSRDKRLAEVDQLFEDIGEFRAELQDYRNQLQHLVWGDLAEPAIAPSVSASAHRIPAARTPVPTKTAAPAKPAARPAIPTKSTTPRKRTVSPVLTATVRRPAAPKSIAGVPSSVRSVTATRQSPAVSPEVFAPVGPLAPSDPNAARIEQGVYDYIHSSTGARLTDIESSLGISRFQAVDALRSLIQQERITQRDRVYLVQEGVTL